jgi:3-oxoacyl-[acyl-carrier protein] reductase
MDLGLKDKVYIVSGSSRGIGKGIAKQLLEEGAKTVVTGRNKEDVLNTYEAFNAQYRDNITYQVGDLYNVDTIKELRNKTVEKWGQIDGIVANAGATKPTPVEIIDDEDWEWYTVANFSLAVRLVQRLVEDLKSTRGNIVFISSIAGLEDLGAPMPYNTSKAALNVYAKSLAARLAKWKIRVNVVAPGNILFPGGSWDTKLKKDPEAINRIIEEKVPLKTFGEPEDIANVVSFLLSNKAKFITGSCFVADGGQTTSFV